MAGLYIHIPFCETKCIYCDFYSMTSVERAERYVHLLCDELKMRVSELKGEKLETIYIGGGTPSQLTLPQLSFLIDGIKSVVDCGMVKEFTIEVNPDDVTAEYMSGVSALGINRVSMGVQSFNDEELMFLHRRHTAQEARHAVEVIKRAGFDNISIDLIYGIPGQTLDTWRSSVADAIALDVSHVSCYNLSYEEGTRLYVMRELGKINECNEDDCILMYQYLIGELCKAGYEHYEISNFAKPGRYSRHNSNYWNMTKYIGIGASAHSFDGELRRYNPNNLKQYMTAIEAGTLCCEIEAETVWQRYNEAVMVMLRTRLGIDERLILQKYGEKLSKHLQSSASQFITKGLLHRTDTHICLTEDGVMLSDMIIRELMYIE